MWKLVQPPERGGLNISPDVVERMTRENAIFYLKDERQVLRETFRAFMRTMKSNPPKDSESAEIVVSDTIEDYYARLRKKYNAD